MTSASQQRPSSPSQSYHVTLAFVQGQIKLFGFKLQNSRFSQRQDKNLQLGPYRNAANNLLPKPFMTGWWERVKIWLQGRHLVEGDEATRQAQENVKKSKAPGEKANGMLPEPKN